MVGYGRRYDGNRRYRVWVKGRKSATERVMPADNAVQAQIRMAAIWDVKTFEVECVWLRDWPKPETATTPTA